jgi:hypothetical protein
MDDNFKTSQKEWSLTEGKGGPGAPGPQYASQANGVPGPVTQPVKGEIFKIDAFTTSQQRAGEHDKLAS